MKIFRIKSKKCEPSKAKLNAAISTALDRKGFNFDSKSAGQLRLKLLEENPKWKLSERRVGNYLKNHLEARKKLKQNYRGAADGGGGGDGCDPFTAFSILRSILDGLCIYDVKK